jgi:Zn-dependent M28 family amino/carboxypeptidase
VIAVRKAGLSGSDHDSFNDAGIPGFSFIQDPLDYWDRTHHLSADTFDHLVEDNLKQAAVVVAATAYHLAMREGLLPRQ